MTTPHVSEVRAQHFRSFGDETVVRLKPGLNLVVGPNGSGKSNILGEDPEHLDAAAVEFRLRDRPASGDRGGGGAWRAGVDELSGGQRTLLNLSVYLAAAKYRPSLVLLMDEVDAALDEHNTQRVAAMLKEVARTSQVVAISHHKEFHELADHMVHLSKASDHTVVR